MVHRPSTFHGFFITQKAVISYGIKMAFKNLPMLTFYDTEVPAREQHHASQHGFVDSQILQQRLQGRVNAIS
jgi:hypothetical protein